MKKILYLTILIIAVCISGCNKKQSINYPLLPEIQGLATPIELEFLETDIVLEDYFRDISRIDSFSVPEYFSYKLTGDDFEILTLTAKNSEIPLMSELKVWVGGFPYSIVLKKNRKVNYLFRFDPKGKKYQKVQLTGTLNNWNPSGTNLEMVDGIWQTKLLLNPGIYQYQVVLDGKSMPDPDNSNTTVSDLGGINSILTVGNTNYASLPGIYTIPEYQKIKIGYDQALSEIFVFWENARLGNDFVIPVENGYEITIPSDSRKLIRSALRIWGYNGNGASNDLFIPISKGKVIHDASVLTREDKHATILYFMMVDRFKNGNAGNDDPIVDDEIAPRANYQGGDIAGIIAKIKDGYFTSLNVNSIWLSPITQNPLTGYVEYPAPHRKYSGYHGYWPITLTTIDHRFGTETELKELVKEAHSRGMNVILDYVSNHVHEENPLFKNNPEWATDLVLPDGSMNIRLWDEQRLTTWFEPFMPSLDFTIPVVSDIMSDSALFWIEHYNLDGFRHDATKHIPTNFWRTLTNKIKTRYPNRSVYQIGETFGSRELIASYLGSGLMDGKFDFNLYFDARSVLASENESFEKLNNSLMESFSYFGYNSLMGNITGNHDMPRFISFASGALRFDENTKEAGWAREIEVKDQVGYDRLNQLLAFTMTIPGVPVIYYGDEIGMPGADDPDSRRMMRFENLSEQEIRVKETTQKLNSLRKSNLEFIYGDFKVLKLEKDIYVFARSYFNKIAVVALNKSSEETEILVELPERFIGADLRSNFNSEYILTGSQLKIKLRPNSFEILTL